MFTVHFGISGKHTNDVHQLQSFGTDPTC